LDEHFSISYFALSFRSQMIRFDYSCEGAGGVAQVEECLPSQQEALIPFRQQQQQQKPKKENS
jgi:hypothetical protein